LEVLLVRHPSPSSRAAVAFLPVLVALAAACGPAGAPDGTVTVQSAVNTTLVVTVVDGAGVPQVDMDVEARRNNGSAFAFAATNSNGRATFVLPDNSYRFVVGELGIEFYSGAAGHCVTPTCIAATVTITRVDVLVVDTSGAPLPGQTVSWETPGGVEDGYTDTGANGHAVLPTPPGSYRFLTGIDGQFFMSGAAGHCTVPGCSTATITIPVPVTVTVRDTTGAPKSGLTVYWRNTANDEGGWTLTNASGVATVLAPQGAHRLVVDTGGGTEYTSGPVGHCVVPGCTSASITVPGPVAVTVTETGGAPVVGQPVVWVNAAGTTGGSTTTNASGVATLTPPLEAVRFRVTVLGTQFFSGSSVHCSPGCTSATISVPPPTVVTVVDGAGAPISGRAVTALLGNATTGTNQTTNPSGQATFRLPVGNWRFRATCTANNEQFFSGNAGHCFIPGGCLTAKVTMPCGQCAGQGTNGNLCNDANPCTTGEACQNQRCVGGTLASCSASDQCHDVGACSAETGTATCSNPPKVNGASCNDANACTQTDSCQEGTCVGANLVVCTASDQCHDPGTCNSGTGTCSNPAKTNGTSCNDNNACTQTDTCQGGACSGSNLVSCAAQDACHVGGTCNPATGTCSASSRAADGTACSDGNRCSTGDSCRAGTCLPGTTNTCAGTGQPNYVSVIDLGSAQGWSYATGINNSGVVVGADVPTDAGIYQLGYAGSKGFRWSESDGQVYLPWPGPVSYAVDINNAGVMSVTAGSAAWEMRPCRYDPGVDAQPVCHANAGNAAGINGSGTVTGSSYYPDGFVRLFRLGTGPIEILPSVPGLDGRAKGVAIADDGTVVGTQMVDGFWQGIRYSAARGPEHLVGLLPAGSGWTSATPSSIRPGEIVGWGYQAGGFGRAFRMKTGTNGDVTAIVALPMPSTFAPNASNIMSSSRSNASGEIVGSVYDAIPFWPQAAFVHSDAVGSVDLNTLVDPQSGWTLKAGFAINDNHEVVGYGVHGGQNRAYKLKLPDLGPCPLQNSCSSGVRDLLSGTCSYTVKPDGAACDDGNACTMGDACTAGACQGSTSVLCVAPDTCHASGTCDAGKPPAQPPSTQDLLGWWRMEGNGDDATGGGHPLTNEGAAPAPGRFGQGMKFDGTACMTAPIWEEARMQGASGVTVMAWVSPSEQLTCPTPGQGLTIAGRGWDYSQGIGCFGPAPAASFKEEVRVAGTVENAGGWGYPGGWGAALPNQWMHVALTYDHANIIMYVNGRLVSTRPKAGQFGNYDPTFAVGCMVSWYWSENQRINQFKGTIDEVMLYRRALSPAEVGAYYTASDPCTHPVLTDGTTCNDSNLCTQTDTCQAGTCVGGNPKTCPAQDQCHAAGTCNPGNGVCSSPAKPDGAACNDGQTCTQSETCLAGACQDTNDYPTVLNLPVQDMGSLGQIQSFAYDINSSGAVVGWSSTDDWQNHAWRFSGTGPLVNLAAQLGLAPPSSAQAINDANTVVGFQTLSDGSHAVRYGAAGLEDFGLVGDGSLVLNNETVLHAGNWVRGAFPTDINNGGDFVGFYTIGGTFGGFRFTDGAGMEDVGTLVADGPTLMEGIAESGTAVGTAATGGTTHAVMYENPVVGLFDLNNLIDPLSGWVLASASGASDDFIVGTGFRDGDGVPRPYRLHRSSGVVDDISRGWVHSGARAVNAAGAVVGTGYVNEADAAVAALSGFVYTDQLGFKNLDDLIPHDFSWHLSDARRINDAGEIVGWGYHTGMNGPRPFRVRLPVGQSATCQARITCGGGDGDPICLYSDGVVETSPGQFVAVFGFDNASSASVHPNVNEVRLDGTVVANPRPAPPSYLPSGTHTGGYLPAFDAGHTISWTVNGETVTASAASPHLTPVPFGASGVAVVIGDRRITVKADTSPYSTPPTTEPIAQPEPTFGEEFVGALAGNLNISPTGAATYTVPIAIPPGIAGMAPNLALVYNSQAGNGIAGQGWELGGLSMIHRCPKTRVQDGRARPIQMDALGRGDGLCLDGKRLFESASSPGTYQSESKDLTVITRIQDPFPLPSIQPSSGSVSFTIVAKNGETRYYGSRAETRVLLPIHYEAGQSSGQKEIAIWPLDRVMDNWGNYFDIHYNDPSTFATDGLLAMRIDYTGHVPGSAIDDLGQQPGLEAAVPPFNSIVFEYDDRTDIRAVRFRESVIPRKKRLRAITTHVDSTVRLRYSLSYLPDNDPMLPSRLRRIDYCSTSLPLPPPPASPPEKCLVPLEFDWDGGNYSWDPAPGYALPDRIDRVHVSSVERQPGTQFVDLNGDDRVDFVRARAGTRTSWENSGQDWQERSAWQLPADLVKSDGRTAGGLFADVDGDGLVDFVSSAPGGSPPAVWLNRIKQECPNNVCWLPSSGFAALPSAWGTNVNFEPTDTRPANDRLADMNGDGRADLVRFGPHDFDLKVLYSTGAGWTTPAETFIATHLGSFLGYRLEDVNRDGLADLVGIGDPDYQEQWNTVALNVGEDGPDGIQACCSVWRRMTFTADPNADAPRGIRFFGDLDGDGFQEPIASYKTQLSIIGTGSVTGQPGITLSTGTGYLTEGASGFLASLLQFGPSAAQGVPFPEAKLLDYVVQVADLNADGLGDLIFNHPDGGQLLANRGTAWKDINNAIGRQTSGGPNAIPIVPSDDPKFTLGSGFHADGVNPFDGRNSGAAFVDLDGDGVLDLVKAHHAVSGSGSDSGVLVSSAWLNKFKPPIISKFPNALAEKTEVTYAVISTAAAQVPGGTYNDSPDLAPGTRYLSIPLRVVASVAADDGRELGTKSRTTYQYQTLRGSAHGRGPQGFQRIEATDAAMVTTRTTYAQIYPYTGMPTSVVRYLNLGGRVPAGLPVLLTKTETDYCDTFAQPTGGGDPMCTSGGAYSPGVSLYVYPWKVTDTTYVHTGEIPQLLGPQTLVTTSKLNHDFRGNLVKSTVTVESSAGEKYETVTENDYGAADSLEAKMGKATETRVTARRLLPAGGVAIQHKKSFEYGTVNQYWLPGAATTLGLKKTRVEPGAGAPIELHTAYTYDRFGNIVTTTTCANDFASCSPGQMGPAALRHRTTKVSYSPVDFAPPGNAPIATLSFAQNGRFPVRTTIKNPDLVDHVEYSAFDPIKGVVLQKTGPNGTHTCFDYDSFGHQTAETARCGGANLTTSVRQYRTTSPTDGKVVTVTRAPTGVSSWTFTDALGRKIETRGRSFDGGFTTSRTVYDALGRLASESKPHLIGDPEYKTIPQYDEVGRVRLVEEDLGPITPGGAPATSRVTTKYLGFAVRTEHTLTGPQGEEIQAREESKNALGKVASVTDAMGVTIRYEYDADGNLTASGDPQSGALPTVRIGYDSRGRKESSIDPDLGTWTYTYNGFGNLVGQTDAKDDTTTMTYDAISRMTSKTTTAGTAHWIYDVAPGAGIGKVAAILSAPDPRLNGTCTIPNVSVNGDHRAGRWFSYTPFGDMADVSECTDGDTFVTSYGYDSFGRQDRVSYPEVTGDRLTVEYRYTGLGFLHYLKDASRGWVYWAATSMNASGQVTGEYTGNGVETLSNRNAATGWLMASTSVAHADGNSLIQNWSYGYDERGNLRFRGRADELAGAASEETFSYDPLNRLKTARVLLPGGGYDTTDSYDYDALGNLTQKGGKQYTYGTCLAGTRSAGPHAVCTVGTGASFAYDQNGNMVSGDGRTVTYGPNNKPLRITSEPAVSQGNDTGVAEFIYGADGHRIVQSVGTNVAGPESERTVYVGLGGTGKSVYERTTRGGTVEHSQFIYAANSHGGSALALRVVTVAAAAPPAEAIKYYHFDHLGSVTAVSDEVGHVVSAAWGGPDAGQMGYDPWGARRTPDGRPANPASFNHQVGRREFTGHETIPNVGLINMNGRVYDPVLGRFLSPDPKVQFVADLQSYNRYSYVLNNPLRYTDPTGYAIFGSNWDSLISFSLGLGSLGVCAATSGIGCVVAGLAATAWNAAVMKSSGASWDQVIAMNAIGLVAGTVSGGVGQRIFGMNTLGAQLFAGGISGTYMAVVSTSMFGGKLGPNILMGAGQGVTMAAISSAAMHCLPLSEANVVEVHVGATPPDIQRMHDFLDSGGYRLVDPGDTLHANVADAEVGVVACQPITRADARQRYGAIDLAQAGQARQWPRHREWIVRFDIPRSVLNDPHYHMVTGTDGFAVNHMWVNRDLVPMLNAAFSNISARGLVNELDTFDGAWVLRQRRGGGSISGHAFGVAVDFNGARNQQGAAPTMSANLVRAFTDAGFCWGGNWAMPDTDGMHFTLGF